MPLQKLFCGKDNAITTHLWKTCVVVLVGMVWGFCLWHFPFFSRLDSITDYYARPLALCMPRGRWWYALCLGAWRL
eukprot:1960004-Amphidinium_carterae.1